MSRDFLLEIGTEEIPSGYLNPALQSMEKNWRALTERNRMEAGEVHAWGTPRRMVLMVKDVAEEQKELVTRLSGPPVRVAFDEEGKPTKAALGFADKCGVSVDELKVMETEKGEYLFAERADKGGEIFRLLPGLAVELIEQIPFPKSMRWGEGEVRFVRPIHWLLCLYGERTVEFEYGGVQSGNLSRGHRFMAPDAFVVETPASYLKMTGERMVIVDTAVRKKMVRDTVHELAAANGGVPCKEDELLDIVSNLVEYPVGVWGRFDEEYLKLPRDVLTTAMVKHQRYFPVERPGGTLMPNFIAVGNTLAGNLEAVAHGNEKVLRARLADAMFFFREDTSRPLEDYVEGLKRVLYQEKLGTSYEKMERFRELVLWLQSVVGAGSDKSVERAAYLSKADLMTQMVYEFPELQGIMGREYAVLCGEDEEVARAIFEHYLPRYSGDELPETHTGALLSIADKLDTIVGSFGIGVKPTGNLDPHGLRRQAIGIINIVIDKAYRFSLSDAVDKALEVLNEKAAGEARKVKDEALDFIGRRLENLCLSDGYRYDLVDAAMGAGFDDLYGLKMRLDALREFSSRPDFEALTTTFKRVVNIIPRESFGDVDESLLAEEPERVLYEGTGGVEKELAGLLAREDYIKALAITAGLREDVDHFFDTVLVMAKDRELRHNRLALLYKVAGLFSSIADFSKIVSGG